VNPDEIILDDKSQNLECSQISVTCKSFHLKVYGIQIVFHNVNQKKSIIVTGIIDDVIIETLNNQFIHDKMKKIKDNIPSEIVDHKKYFDRFLSCLSLKDLLISSREEELFNKSKLPLFELLFTFSFFFDFFKLLLLLLRFKLGNAALRLLFNKKSSFK
jgi:hypothetical protein